MLREEEVDAVVHAAFFTNPRRDTAYAHELESIGTLNLLAAAAAAGVAHVVMRSFTAVYGARGQNPNFLTEEQPLQPSPALAWARDKLEAEQHAASFARRYPGLGVTVLRFAPLLRARASTPSTRAIFDHRVVPVLMGYDPLVQLLHPEDAVAAVRGRRSSTAPGGAFNIVPSRPIPLLTALHLAAKVPVLGAAPARLRGRGPAVGGGPGAAPGGFVDYVRYPVRGGRREGAPRRWASRRGTRAATRSWPTCATGIPRRPRARRRPAREREREGGRRCRPPQAHRSRRAADARRPRAGARPRAARLRSAASGAAKGCWWRWPG